MSRHGKRDRTRDLLEHAENLDIQMDSKSSKSEEKPAGTVGVEGCPTCNGRGFEVLDEVPEGRRSIGKWWPGGWIVECACAANRT